MEQRDGDDIRARVEGLMSVASSLTTALEMLSSAVLFSTLRPDVRQGVNFYEEVTRFEVLLIEDAMRLAHGNQVRAAQMLGLNNTTLNAKIKKYKINSRTGSKYLANSSIAQSQCY